MSDDRDRDDLILDLIMRQQKASEQTGNLLESLMSEMARIRRQCEGIGALAARIENVERFLRSVDQQRLDTMAKCADEFRELNRKREEIKDGLASVERSLERQISAFRDDLVKDLDLRDRELRAKIEAIESPLSKSINELREKMAYSAGKYGGIAAVLVLVAQWVLGWMKGKM
ncbi:hypothetical protein DSTSK_02630 [Desulforhabdus sp. TSK]|nr:hypothetical protein DSTSK_02630 [Desulforhabdus sp. TSK]